MGREIRRVPKNWEHPKESNGNYESLVDDYIGSLKYYKKEVEEFIEQMTEVIESGDVKIYDTLFKTPQEAFDYLTEDEITPPDIHDYMPEGSWYQLFENVSEGTPLSPPFETKEELIKWLTDNEDFWGNTWGEEGAKDIVNSKYAPSGILVGGNYYKPEDQHKIKPTKNQEQ